MDTLLATTQTAQPPENTPALLAAAKAILDHITPGLPLTTADLKTIMTRAYRGSDGEGAWDWKTAYDAGEIASVLFVRKFGPAMLKRAGGPHAFLDMLEKIGKLLPTHTRRSETSQSYQQFSTPMSLAYVASVAAQMTSADVVLEPSAGPGLLAVFAEIAGGRLVLNEIAANRRPILEHSFPGVPVSGYDAASIHDLLSAEHTPTLIVMNPPFSVAAHVDGPVADAALRHIVSALARLAPGGRLVTITGANLYPTNPRWRAAFADIQKGTGQPTFAEPGFPDDDQVLMLVDPVAGDELGEQRLVEAARGFHVGVLDDGILPEPGELQSTGEPLVFPFDGFAIDEKSEPFLE